MSVQPNAIPWTDWLAQGRDSTEELRRKSILVQSVPLVQALIDAMPGGVMILNDKRQIIAANRSLLESIYLTLDDVLGRRLGEILGCSNWREGPDGCGTSRQCLNCGALKVIHQSLSTGGQALGESELTVERPIQGASLVLRVKATAFTIQEERFTVCALENTTSRRRVAELSTIFFHDLLNTVSGIQGHLGLLGARLAKGEDAEDMQRLRWLADQLTDDIESQRDLVLAETGDLQVQPQVVRTEALLSDLRSVYSLHPAGAGRSIQTGSVWDGIVITDLRLLTRVLGNMLRNALEATEPGGTITLGCAAGGDDVAFSVHNPAVIPEAVQSQLFKRSFSTKDSLRRGIGTRSMKLLGEHYLRGTVGLVSGHSTGTIFTLTVPKVLLPESEQMPAAEHG